MLITAYPEVDTPYLFPAYDSTLLRAPLESLIEAPQDMVGQSPGPDFRRIPVPADGADLLHRHEGEPIGERIVSLRFDIRLQGPGETAFFAF